MPGIKVSGMGLLSCKYNFREFAREDKEEKINYEGL